MEPKLHKKGDHYYAVFYDPDRHPTRKWVSLKTTREKLAWKRLNKLDEGLHFGTYDPWEDAARFKAIAVTDAVALYLRERAGERTPKTQANDRRLFDQFVGTLKPRMQLGHVTGKDVRAFIEAPKAPRTSDPAKGKPPAPRSDSTKRTYHARLNAFFRWAERERHVKKNPMDRLPKAPKSDPKPLYLTREQYRAVLQAIEGDAEVKGSGAIRRTSLQDGQIVWLADIVRVAVGTGLRSGEIRNLRWSAVNLHDETLTVKNTATFRTKNGRERTVPIAGDALATLRRLDAARPDLTDRYVFEPTSKAEGTADVLDGIYLNKRFKKYAALTGAPRGVTFHTLRHTYASWLVMDGTSLSVVKELMGHRTIQVTEVYAHLAPDLLKSAVRRTFQAPLVKTPDT